MPVQYTRLSYIHIYLFLSVPVLTKIMLSILRLQPEILDVGLRKLIRMYKVTYMQVNSAFHPSGVDKSSTGVWLGLRRGVFACVRMAGDPIWQVTPHSSEIKFH